jgi:hypothetical protein
MKLEKSNFCEPNLLRMLGEAMMGGFWVVEVKAISSTTL